MKSAERNEGSVLHTQTTHRPCRSLAKKATKNRGHKKNEEGNLPIAMLQIKFAGLNHHQVGHHIID